jgi:hypothetical protein
MGLLHKGSRVGSYVAVRKLGEGRFAEVWEVQDTAAAKDAPHVSRVTCVCCCDGGDGGKSGGGGGGCF